MIQLRTVLNVADNSGAKKILCIQVKGGSFRKTGSVGDVIVASVKEALPNSNVNKGDVIHAAAAGFTVEGDLDEVLATVLPKLRDLVDVPDWRDATGSLV